MCSLKIVTAFVLTLAAAPLAATAESPSPGFTTIPASAWDRAAVERVLHTFAYGGRVSESNITRWVNLGPTAAIKEMLALHPYNPLLAPRVGSETLPKYVNSLRQLQSLFESTQLDNPLCPAARSSYATYVDSTGDDVWYSYQAVQRTWLAAAHLRGANPFRHKVGLWLTNYLMVSSLEFTKINLIRDHYDASLHLLASGAPLWQALAEGAASAAIASEYGHRSATYNNATGKFSGTDDFARELHQLFFRINGTTDGAEYHEDVTIENTALLLTGMGVDKIVPPPGIPLRDDNRWTAPIVFTDHTDPAGTTVMNQTHHHQAPLEILRTAIDGATAEEKLYGLAAVAILHPESLDNLPVEIIRFFGDDNLTDDKINVIRSAWRQIVGQPNDLREFLRQYAISTTFHDPSTFKYATPFDLHVTAWNISNGDNEEFYTINPVPLSQLTNINSIPFDPIFRIFGHQTGLTTANDSGIFRSIYNLAVTTSGPMDSTATCKDYAGYPLWTWNRDWRQIVPANARGQYLAGDVARWLWQRLTADSGANYTILERAHLAAILAMRTDLATIIDPSQPQQVYRTADLEAEPLHSLIIGLEAVPLALNSADANARSKANNNIAMAVNFIRATPFTFAMEAR